MLSKSGLLLLVSSALPTLALSVIVRSLYFEYLHFLNTFAPLHSEANPVLHYIYLTALVTLPIQMYYYKIRYPATDRLK